MHSWTGKQIRSFRWRTGIVAGLFAISAAWAWAHTYSGAPLRNLINRTFTSYVGCQCDDCAERFLVVAPPTSSGWCGTGALRRDTNFSLAGIGLGSLSFAAAAYGIIAPVRARQRAQREFAACHLCPSCGYSRDGLASCSCPECGAHWPTRPPHATCEFPEETRDSEGGAR